MRRLRPLATDPADAQCAVTRLVRYRERMITRRYAYFESALEGPARM